MHEMKTLRPLALVGGIIGILFLISLPFANTTWSTPFFATYWGKKCTATLIAAHLEKKRARIPDGELRELAKTIYEASRSYGVDYRLVLAVMEAESNFRQDVVSNKGAIGIMQVKTIVAREFSRQVGIFYKKNVLNCPHANVRFGVYYLSWLGKYFNTDRAVLFAYNVGFTRARQVIGKNSEPKTAYTQRVFEEYERNCTRLPMDEAVGSRQSIT
jgi:soluble lytic murein transglycosylase